MQRGTRKAAAVILAAGIIGIWLWPDSADTQRGRTEDPALLVDRVWVDSVPEKFTDYTHVFLVVDSAPAGLFQKASAYRATFELFQYKRVENRMSLYFPQSGKSKRFTFKIRRCDDLPPFDLCLELSSNPWGGPKRYYGLADSESEAGVLGAVAESARAHLRHLPNRFVGPR